MNLAILGSHRRNSNTEIALKRLSPIESYSTVNLLDLDINPYRYASRKTEGDDFLTVARQMAVSSNIIFATPVYWYAMSGLMKNFFDRFTDLMTTQKDLGRSLRGRNCYLIACGSDEVLPAGFEVPFRLTCEYFEMKLRDVRYLQMNES